MRVFLAILSFAICAGFGGAAWAEDEPNCDDPEPKYVAICSRLEADEADRILNQTYQSLLAASSDEERALLVESERAWVTYKEKLCRYVGLGRKGGSMQGMVISTCLRDMANDQNKILQWQLECPHSAGVSQWPGKTCTE